MDKNLTPCNKIEHALPFNPIISNNKNIHLHKATQHICKRAQRKHREYAAFYIETKGK